MSQLSGADCTHPGENRGRIRLEDPGKTARLLLSAILLLAATNTVRAQLSPMNAAGVGRPRLSGRRQSVARGPNNGVLSTSGPALMLPTIPGLVAMGLALVAVLEPTR